MRLEEGFSDPLNALRNLASGLFISLLDLDFAAELDEFFNDL